MLRVGVVVFDDPVDPAQGWSCIAGEKYPRRIKGVQALRSDVCWMLSCDSSVAYNQGLSNNAFFRSNAFLPVKMSDLRLELGLTSDFSFEQKAIEGHLEARLLADVFERFVKIQCAFLGIERANWRPPMFDARKMLRETLVKADQKVDSDLLVAASEARQDWVSCHNRFKISDHEYKKFYKPRMAHALSMLEVSVPTEPKYTALPGSKLPTNRHEFAEWALSQKGPVLARAVIHEIDDSVSSVISYGGIARRDIKIKGDFVRSYMCTRQWLTTHDLVALMNNATIEIKEALVFDESVCKPPLEIPQVAQFFESITPAECVSHSMGMFAAGLWSGLLMHNPRPMQKDVSTNLWAPFIRSYDRLLCMMSASELTAQGYLVAGYGAGKIHAWLPKEATNDVLQVCRQADVLPMMLPPSEESMNNAAIFQSDSSAWGTSMLMLSGGLAEDYLMADDEIVDDWLSRYAAR
jgi:hypothetical protein